MVKDPLTGVYSRATLGQRLHEEIDRARRYEIPLTIIMLDLDHYKSVNDAFGHLRGDSVLVHFAQRLRTAIRKSDLIYRYGGDEFLLLLPNTSKAQGAMLASRLIEAIRNDPFPGEPPISLTISLGVASFPDDGHTPETLFERADRRHYAAKRRGRDRMVEEDPIKEAPLFFDPDARLVERDDGLFIMQRFLDSLPDKNQGILIITGPAGSGRSRFLAEVGKNARLQGYEVIPIHASPALKNRAYGDLAEVVKNLRKLPSPSDGVEIFQQGLVNMVIERGRSGVLFAVDDLPDVDWSTLELLRHLLLAADLPIQCAVALTARHDQNFRMLLPFSPLVETVELSPLSQDGFRICLRYMLQWEPQADFTEWLYYQTSGLPAFLERGLIEMVQQGILERFETGWTLVRNFASFSLKERLGLKALQPFNNLPAMPTAFLGREEEIQHARNLLSSTRLLTLSGTGGVGKTRLAIQVAAEMMDYFPNGVYWVPLASVSSADTLATSIASAIKFSFYNNEDPEGQLAGYLREKQALLLMDNFEHLIPGARLISYLMQEAPHVKFLVTSRERLNIHGESVMELRGIHYPQTDSDEKVESYAATQLFVQSARRVQPDFRLTEENKQAITRICQTLEGLPLGIELASSWVRILSCQEILAEIAGNLDFLTTTFQDMPARHRSLRAVFEHSWNLLTPDEQKVMSALSVFRGWFTRQAAAEVADATLAILISLLDKSLLYKAGEGYYTMHEVLHEYTLEKLAGYAPLGEQIFNRHCGYYTKLLNKLEPHLADSRQKDILDEINTELANIRAAWQFAVAHRLTRELNNALHSLYFFYDLRGLVREGEHSFHAARLALESTYKEEYPLIYARLTVREAVFLTRLAQYDEATTLFETSLEIFRSQENLEEEAFALLMSGSLQSQAGYYVVARQTMLQSLELYRRIDQPLGIGRALSELGSIEYNQGDYHQAESSLRESLRICREINDNWGLARTLSNLGNIESELGEYTKAKEYYLESLDLCAQIGLKSGIAATLNNIGDIARENNDAPGAREFLTRSIQVCAELGDQNLMAISLANLGDVEFRSGNLDQARNYLNRSLEICMATNDPVGAAYALTILGNVATSQGNYQQASEHLLRAMQLNAENGALPQLLQATVGLAELQYRRGKLEEALELLRLANDHPAISRFYREDAVKLLRLVEAELTADFYQDIVDRTTSLSDSTIIQRIIEFEFS